MTRNPELPGKGTPIAGPSLLEGVSLPAAVVFDSALTHNIAWMQRFADDHGANGNARGDRERHHASQ